MLPETREHFLHFSMKQKNKEFKNTKPVHKPTQKEIEEREAKAKAHYIKTVNSHNFKSTVKTTIESLKVFNNTKAVGDRLKQHEIRKLARYFCYPLHADSRT